MSTTYRVLTARLRVKRTDGQPRLDVARPVDQHGRFTDSVDQPTLITLDAGCRVDVAYLLQIGAIIPVVEAPLPPVLAEVPVAPIIPEVRRRHG